MASEGGLWVCEAGEARAASVRWMEGSGAWVGWGAPSAIWHQQRHSFTWLGGILERATSRRAAWRQASGQNSPAFTLSSIAERPCFPGGERGGPRRDLRGGGRTAL